MQITKVLFPVVLLCTCPVALSALQKTSQHHDNGHSAQFTSHLAQKSAQQAHHAVSVQHVSGQKASFIAKSVLADAALQAAATAEVALASKHALLENLEKLRAEAYHSLQAELIQLEQAHHAVATASKTAQQAANQVKVLSQALKHSQQVAKQAAVAAEHARAELASQEKMVMKAKARLEAIESKLQEIQADIAKIKYSAKEATAAAYDAYNTVNHVGGSETYAGHREVYYTSGDGTESDHGDGYGGQVI